MIEHQPAGLAATETFVVAACELSHRTRKSSFWAGASDEHGALVELARLVERQVAVTTGPAAVNRWQQWSLDAADKLDGNKEARFFEGWVGRFGSGFTAKLVAIDLTPARQPVVAACELSGRPGRFAVRVEGPTEDKVLVELAHWVRDKANPPGGTVGPNRLANMARTAGAELDRPRNVRFFDCWVGHVSSLFTGKFVVIDMT